ncbi:unnamed protein product [Lymnaea stagnalis]|uniref:G-protein coupled receptors family 1 profile domain-containing protein n=1 Tax=Lymnaea stagnalis TaxID=6523 RepID=A0AAV2ID63_LYMST
MYGYGDSGFDLDAYRIAYKALYIIFIILILLANGLLIFKNVRKCEFMYKPKTLTILSLAVGDVFLALFPMVVQTKFYFGDYAMTGLSCSTSLASLVYTPYLVTFVYGTGLMVLGFEIIQSQKSSPTNKNTQIIYSLGYSSFPWILGLIIVLPLGMANYNVDMCQGTQTLGQARALVVIGIILPACGAVFTSIFVKNRKSQAVNSPAQAVVVFNSHATAPPIQTTNPAEVIPVSPNHPQSSMFASPTSFPTQGQPPQFYNQPPTQGQQTQFYNQPHSQGQPPLFYYQPPTHGQPPQLYNQPYTEGQYPSNLQQSPPYHNQPPTQPYYKPVQTQYPNPTYYHCNVSGAPSQTGIGITAVTAPSGPTPKVNRLLSISIIYFVLVIPIAIYNLSYTLNLDRVALPAVPFAVLDGLVLWLSIARSFITPLMMYRYSDD